MRRRYMIPAGLLVAAFGFIFGTHAAFAQGATDDPSLLAEGQAVFEATCAGCHGADGMGTQQGRSLIGVAEQQPDRLVHIASVTNGKGFMPSFSDSLAPDEIEAAVTYVRLTFVSEAAQTEPVELAVTGASSSELAVTGAFLVMLGGVSLALAGRRGGAGDPVR